MFEIMLLALMGTRPAIKADKTYEQYKLVRLAAENVPPKAGVVWRVRPGRDVDRSSQTDRNKLEFVAPPGAYDVEILVVTVAADGQVQIDESTTTITIGPKQPDPPGPGDPLAEALRGIYGGLQDDAKAEKVQALTKAHKRGLELLADPATQTAGQLYSGMKAAVTLAPTDIKPIRDRIAEEYAQALPTDPAVVLSSDQRAAATKLFGRVVSILEGLK
jgi:hypothetical protein